MLSRPAAPPPRVRAFPWGTLPRFLRSDLTTVGLFRDWLSAHVEEERILEVATEVLGEAFTVDLSSATAAIAPPRSDVADMALAFGLTVDGAPGGAVVLEVPRELAARALSRALSRPVPFVHDPEAPPSAAFVGAWGALVVAVARRAGASVAPSTVGRGTDLTPGRGKNPDGEQVSIAFTVRISGQPFGIRVRAARTTLLARRGEDVKQSCAKRQRWHLGEARISLPVVVSEAMATAREIASLEVGDAWMPGLWPLRRGESGEYEGPVSLASPLSSRSILAELISGGHLTIGRRGSEATSILQTTEEGCMSDTSDVGSLLEAIGDLPVTVRVELGSVELRARDWASLSTGDVLTFDKRVGAPVALRVGGAIVAHGELVEVEGEVGVRILERVVSLAR